MTDIKNQVLHSEFIVELAKVCLTNSKILAICQKEMKFHYLENEAQKLVFKYIYDTFEVTNTAPTVGIIGQQFTGNKNVIEFLAQVKKAPKIENDKIILELLSDHVKKIRFANLLDHTVDLYNKGQKDEAYAVLKKESEEIEQFSFVQHRYKTVFGDFDERLDQREQERIEADDSTDVRSEKCPFGILALDEHTTGGVKKGSAALIMARSGGGKSTMLRWMGVHNARMGHRVVHFQAEGSEKDCFDLYDSTWTGVMTEDMALGVVSDGQKQKINKTRRDILARGGEIYVYASETFDSMSLETAREILVDIETIYGPVDLVLFDYLEIFNVNGKFVGESGERRRREVVANKMTNIAVEFNCAVVAATQANDIAPKDYNNPDFVLTRHHISEFKGAVKPFSYFITINGTDEQRNSDLALLYGDKFRYHKAGVKIPIVQDLSSGRFYNSTETIKMFYSSKGA